MIPLDEAQSLLLAGIEPLPSITLPVAEAAGYWASEDIVAKRTQPARALSAMDGYAVAANGCAQWQVVGESAAGRPFDSELDDEQAVRIFTGAALPVGADAIIMQENALRDGEVVSVTPENTPSIGRHVRLAGSDFRAGDTLVTAGERMTAARIGLAIGGGHGTITVRRRPRITLLATGNELVAPGEDPGTNHLPESNSLMIASMLRDWPCDVDILPVAPDDLETLATIISAVDADLLVTMGGASVGDHDLVKPALEKCGATLDFWKVAMRPGKPVMAGRLGNMVVLGLPGNPVSAFVTALLLANPVIAKLAGASDPLPQHHTVRLATSFPANGSRLDHVRARMTPEGAVPVGPNDSAGMGGLANADILIIRPVNAPATARGDFAEAIRIA